MSVEIEHKFLVKNNNWKKGIKSFSRIAQGYLNSDPERTTRVRVKGDKGFITIKGKNDGIARTEFEYEIPLKDAEQLLHLCEQPLIEKIRSEVQVGKHTWEVDEFFGNNEGLLVAEIELKSTLEEFDVPEWAGENVSNDKRYYNSSLIKNPYKKWNLDIKV